MQYYEEARALHLDALATPTTGPEHAHAMDEVAKRLRAAITTAAADEHSRFGCPLFRSRMGELLLEVGREQTDAGACSRAFELLESSVNPPTGCSEWIPGWLGLAHWAILEVRADSLKGPDADAYLQRAARELSMLHKRSKDLPPPPASYSVPLLSASSDRTDDPSPTSQQQIGALWQWIALNEQWLDATFEPHLPAIAGETAPALDIERLYRRLRARIEYLRAVIQVRRNEPASYTLQRLASALEWDRDFYPAHLEIAAQHRKAGQLLEAEARLRPYLLNEASSPAFRNNPRLWLEAGRIYAAMDAQTPSEEHAANAERAYTHLLGTLEAADAESCLEFAQFYITAARKRPSRPPAERRHYLRNGEQMAAEARKLGADPNRVQQLMAEAAALRSDIGG